MSAAAIELAACTRALLHRIAPDEQYDDARIYSEFIKPVENELVPVLIQLQNNPNLLNILAKNSLAVIAATPSAVGCESANEAHILVENADRQHSGMLDYIVVAGIISLFGGVVAVSLILAARIASIKIGENYATFYKGVPEEIAEPVKRLVSRPSSFEHIADQLLGESQVEGKKG